MSIILNEEQAALDIIARNDLGNKPSESILLLIKYYKYIQGLKKKNVLEKIEDFIKSTGISYKPSDWEKCINRQYNKSLKRSLLNIDYIPITKNELEIIKNIQNIELEKLAFTLLCISKYYNIVFKDNNNWVNTKISQIFVWADFKEKNKSYKNKALHSLYNLNLIALSNNNTNTNIKVEYIGKDIENVSIKIRDMRELGKEYENLFFKKYINCKNCGRLIKKTNNKKKYCDECSHVIKNKQHLNSYYKNKHQEF